MNAIETPPFRLSTIPIWTFIGCGSLISIILALVAALKIAHHLHWDLANGISITVILGIAGGLSELVVLLTSDRFNRAGSFFAIVAGLLIFWSTLIVGLIGNQNDPTNLLFGFVLFLAIMGAWLSILHRFILPLFMFCAGTTQALIGLFAGLWGNDAEGGLATILMSSLWLIASALFAVGNLKRPVAP